MLDMERLTGVVQVKSNWKLGMKTIGNIPWTQSDLGRYDAEREPWAQLKLLF